MLDHLQWCEAQNSLFADSKTYSASFQGPNSSSWFLPGAKGASCAVQRRPQHSVKAWRASPDSPPDSPSSWCASPDSPPDSPSSVPSPHAHAKHFWSTRPHPRANVLEATLATYSWNHADPSSGEYVPSQLYGCLDHSLPGYLCLNDCVSVSLGESRCC